MTNQNDEILQQLVDLQTQQAFQEDIIATLDGVVTRQQQQIDRMQMQIDSLKKRFETLPESLNSEIHDEKPPHY